MIGVSMRRLAAKGNGLEERITSSILINGGSYIFPVMAEWFESLWRLIQFWMHGELLLLHMQFPVQTFSREDFYKTGFESIN